MDLPKALAVLAPTAKPLALEAFALAPDVLPRFEISTPLRVSHFLAQVLHETGGLSNASLEESLNYSPERLLAAFKKYYPTQEEARAAGIEKSDPPEIKERKRQAIANRVYGGRMGNTLPGDGWAFRGRGLIQITGREMYARISGALGIDLIAQPWLACHPEHALSVAAAFWTLVKKLNGFADEDDLLRVSVGVNGCDKNGKPNGLEDRAAWLAKVKGTLRA